LHVAVCIVSYRNPQDVSACLATLARSTHADFEVVICENGGQEAFAHLRQATPARLAGGQVVRLLLAPSNLGYGGGVNACLRAAPEVDAWWILNPDTEPQADALETLLARLARGDCELVGATVHSASGRVESRAGRWRAPLARAESIGSGAPLDERVDAAQVERAASYVSGSCMLVSRRFLQATGPMREDYFLYCEEVEWCIRGTQLGLRIGYAPQARVLHRKGTTTGSVGDVRKRPRLPVYLDERNKILLTRDRFGAWMPVAAAFSLLILLLRFGKRGAWRQIAYGCSGWLAGLRDERGPPTWMSV
jgi:N-acetylglucosaminyl-diphospho-decaprenol L-rhamnosyltransferase